jgi:hypothetical protein
VIRTAIGAVLLSVAAFAMIFGASFAPTTRPRWNRLVFPAALLVSVVCTVLGIYRLATA